MGDDGPSAGLCCFLIWMKGLLTNRLQLLLNIGELGREESMCSTTCASCCVVNLSHSYEDVNSPSKPWWSGAHLSVDICARMMLVKQVLMESYALQSGVMDETAQVGLLAAWMALFALFASRKFTQPIKDDIGDKSVFIFNALPEEEQQALLQRLQAQEALQKDLSV